MPFRESDLPPAIVVTLAGLNARYLGAYGNDTVLTPHLDRFAGDSMLLDQVLSINSGALMCVASAKHGKRAEWCRWLKDRAQGGQQNLLVTDDVALASAAEESFSVVSMPLEIPTQPAEDVWETHLANWFALGAEMLDRLEPGSLLWLHSESFLRVWDAPMAWRERMIGEGDPSPTSEVAPPAFTTDDDEEIWRQRATYSAQIGVLDECWGFWWELCRQKFSHGPSPLMVIASTGGYPLGEHGVVGLDVPCPYHERWHVPWIGQLGSPGTCGARFGQLLDVEDGWQLVQAALSGKIDEALRRFGRQPNRWREVVIGTCGDARLLRTHAWYYVERDGRTELYLKPDDRWDQNDVSRRCQPIVEGLGAWWRSLDQQGAWGALVLESDMPSEFVRLEP